MKIGSDNDGAGNGSFWFEQGDASPPFTHAGHIVISRGSQITLTVNGPGTAGLGVDAPYHDESQTRLDFFTSSKGTGWVVAHVLKPEIADTRPAPPKDERPSVHQALCSAAELAIREGDLEFLKMLIKRGLQINEALDFEEGHTALHRAVWHGEIDIVKYLLEQGADREARNRFGERPIDEAIQLRADKLYPLLAKPPAKDEMVDGIPVGVLEQVLPRGAGDEVFFVSWDEKDPSPELLASIRKILPKARPASRMKTLERRPLGAHSWYQDKDNREFGSLIEVKLGSTGEIWTARVRTTVGPVMAGGGWEGQVSKAHGYWHLDGRRGWDE